MHKIPEVPFLVFVRNAFTILKNPLPFHHRNFEKLGDTFRLKLGFGKSVIFSRDAGMLQYVLQKNQRNYTKSPIQTKDLAKYIGRGLLTAEGAHWQKQRKMIQPAFHKKQLALLLDTIEKVVEEEISKIQTDVAFDLFPICNDLAFQVVAKSLFSSAISKEEIVYIQDITETAQKMLVRELRQPYLGWWFKLSGKIKANLKNTQEARSILQKLVSDRRASGERFDDLLDMLLDARYEDGTGMDDTQLIDEILILFIAGHETTSNALTFAAQLLAQHPAAQEKILEEYQAIPEDADFMSRLKQSVYAQNVMEETMRLYPPAYFIDRINYEDDSYNGVALPKGSNLLFSVIEIHNKPTLWEDVASFKPERFSEMKKTEYSSHYFPFGAGPRMCIGNNFAMFEMIIAIQTLVSKFKISEKKTPIAITPLITLKPKNAILTFQQR